MIKIRLARGGAKNNPVYRIVVIEAGRKRGGKALEVLGYWHPKKNVKQISKDKLKHWVSMGAKTTKAVDKLLEDID